MVTHCFDFLITATLDFYSGFELSGQGGGEKGLETVTSTHWFALTGGQGDSMSTCRTQAPPPDAVLTLAPGILSHRSGTAPGLGVHRSPNATGRP